ncbi:hypothetical protein [Cupriavidus sp. YR651]|nr:hypothetical protein [Cupriavidus sp. YR651]
MAITVAPALTARLIAACPKDDAECLDFDHHVTFHRFRFRQFGNSA